MWWDRSILNFPGVDGKSSSSNDGILFLFPRLIFCCLMGRRVELIGDRYYRCRENERGINFPAAAARGKERGGYI